LEIDIRAINANGLHELHQAIAQMLEKEKGANI
jgi:hypothetical protein